MRVCVDMDARTLQVSGLRLLAKELEADVGLSEQRRPGPERQRAAENGLARSGDLSGFRPGMGNEAELLAGRALNELQELELEPRAATLTAHLVDVLRRNRTPFLFVDFDPADGCGFSGCGFQLYSSHEQRNVGGLGGAFLHNQLPQ